MRILAMSILTLALLKHTASGAPHEQSDEHLKTGAETQVIHAPTPSDVWFFGRSISLSAEHLAVSSIKKDRSPTRGVVHVFPRTGGRVESSDQILEADDIALEQGFGFSLDVTAQLLAVGSVSLASPTAKNGVIIFRLEEGDWRKVAALRAAGVGSGERYGWKVEFAAGTLLVAAPATQEGAVRKDNGAVYSYRMDGNQWVLSQRIVSPEPRAGLLFGGCLSASDNHLVIGEDVDALPYVGGGGTRRSGRVHSYRLDEDGTWRLSQVLESERPGDAFGCSVAVSDEWLVVGSYGSSPGGSDSAGSATVYRYCEDRKRWVEPIALDRPNPTDHTYFGVAVELTSDMPVVIASRPASAAMLDRPGGAYVFQSLGAGTTPRPTQLLRCKGRAEGLSGCTDTSLHGTTLAVGTMESGGARAGGAVYLFDL